MNLLEYLKLEPKARERKNKNRAIGNIIKKKYYSNLMQVEQSRMADIVSEVLNLDRKWRLILKENPDLRGSDYKEKDILEQEKMLQLGYEPNYFNDIKQSKLL